MVQRKGSGAKEFQFGVKNAMHENSSWCSVGIIDRGAPGVCQVMGIEYK